MKIAIIGSTQYKQKFFDHAEKMITNGHEIRIPAFDDHPELDELGVCLYNREAIIWADRIDVIWDQRSIGTIFDFGMVFMANKPIKIVYLEQKTFRGVFEKYEAMHK